MSAAALALVGLVEAGATIGADAGGFSIAAPGTLPAPMLDRARAGRAALLVVASDAWRDELDGWGPELVDLWQERAAIMTADAGSSVELAERAAYLDIRERALAPAADLVKVLAAAGLGPVLLVERRPATPPAEALTT